MRIVRKFYFYLALVSISIGLTLLYCSTAQNWLLSLSARSGIRMNANRLFSQIDLLAAEAVFRGFLLLLAVWILWPHWQKIKAFLHDWNRTVWIAVLLLTALTLPVIAGGHSAMIACQRYWWLSDDAMISMRYAHNFADGLGMVWNAGERVEGYTNFLWTLFMSLFHFLPIPLAQTSFFILVANLLLSLAAIFLLRRFIRILGGGDLLFSAVLVSYILNKNLLAWSTSGFETILLMVLVLLTACRVLEERLTQEPRLGTFLLIASMSLIRADALVLSGLFYLMIFFLQAQKSRVVWLALVSLILPLSHLLFRIYYYGEWLPNTAYLKTTLWPGRFTSGLGYALGFIWHYFILIVLAVAGTLKTRHIGTRYLLAAVGLFLIYVAYAGGDAFGNYRFMVPVLPLLLVLGYHGIDQISGQRPVRFALAILCFITLPLSPLSYKKIITPSPFDTGNVEIGLLLKQNTPADCRVADCWGGSVFYFSERYGVDVLGKMDGKISRRPAFPGANLPGHNKFDYDYSLGILQPDLIVANFKWPAEEAEMRSAASGDWAFVGQLYFNPFFQKKYFPNPVPVNTFRTIFIRDGSPLTGLVWRPLVD